MSRYDPVCDPYDSLNRLTGYQRGQLNSTCDGLLYGASNSDNYSMDALGNLLTYRGTSRTFNGQNQIATGITDWAGNGIQYDAAGEVTKYIPTASSPDTWLIYDAWGRVVRI